MNAAIHVAESYSQLYVDFFNIFNEFLGKQMKYSTDVRGYLLKT